MKVSVQGRNIGIYRKLFEIAAKFYGKELMTTRMCNTLQVVIKVQKSTLKKNELGLAKSSALGSKPNKKFTIIIRNTCNLLRMLESLAHEMVHVEQVAMNRYQQRVWKTDKKVHARWLGKEMGVKSELEYWTRPWEVEARSKQKDLLYKFRVNYSKKAA